MNTIDGNKLSLSCLLEPTVKVTAEDAIAFFSKDPGLPSFRVGRYTLDATTDAELRGSDKALGVLNYVPAFRRGSECWVQMDFHAQFTKQDSTGNLNACATSTFKKEFDGLYVHTPRRSRQNKTGRPRKHAFTDSPSSGPSSPPSTSESACSDQACQQPVTRRICNICGVNNTPRWRRSERKMVCNACGLRARPAMKRSKRPGVSYAGPPVSDMSK
eukprot:GILJ01006045.1.p1 GENE.GILJ01006045.1~~GILJ01006045.1.p1  ORF type:complete len:216 (+),score=9.70 GILJ01006045.1:59-706(+)